MWIVCSSVSLLKSSSVGCISSVSLLKSSSVGCMLLGLIIEIYLVWVVAPRSHL